MSTPSSCSHPFLSSPHRTFFALSLPVMFSLIAEPLTGLVDTAFVSRLGAAPLSALGVGTMVLSSVFWIFNFLSIGTQTEIAQARGRGDLEKGRRISGLALLLGLCFGVLLAVAAWFCAAPVARLMGAADTVHAQAVVYIRLRTLGAPAVLITLTAFGAMYGLQNMRTPLMIACTVNGLNIILDAVLIFGYGPIPALGIGGAALASSVSQWVGAAWALLSLYRRLGFPDQLQISDLSSLLRIGRDMIIRTGLLTLFLLLATRAATRIGPEAGAAHQAVRQVWVFSNLFLDAAAVTAQSLVAFFVGCGEIGHARRAAKIICIWCTGAGFLLTLLMLAGQNLAVLALVPPAAVAWFGPAWLVAALAQPVSALSFVTDGIHWGTGDFGFLRNVVVLATGSGVIGLLLLDLQQAQALTWIWIITGGWIVIRGLFGMLRIWPGIGKSPFSSPG